VIVTVVISKASMTLLVLCMYMSSIILTQYPAGQTFAFMNDLK